MGAKESRPAYLSYEEALKRVGEGEVRRLREAHRKASDANLLSPAAFSRLVLAGAAPQPLAERLFVACGGTRKGLAFKDLLCGLVLLTKGAVDERIKFLWSLYCNEAGTHISRADFIEAIQAEKASLSAWKACQVNTNIHMVTTTLFGQTDRVNFDTFRSWILIQKNATVFSHWLLIEPPVNLTADLDTPTFYQSLAGVTHLEEKDIYLLEKYFWRLINTSGTGQLDVACLGPLLSPPVPKAILNGLLLALDENRDGHVDFKELCCGLSAACRGPILERVKFCFKIFDTDRDGILNEFELNHMINILCFVANESVTCNTKDVSHLPDNKFKHEVVFDSLKGMMSACNTDTVTRKRSKDTMFRMNSANMSTESENGACLNSVESSTSLDSIRNDNGLSQESFLIWHVDKGNSLVAPFLQLIFQVCHIVLGLRPQCKHQEQEIGWLSREVQRGYSVGQFWYLISSDWWNSWLAYTNGNTTSGVDKSETCYACKISSQKVTPHPGVDEAIVCDENFNNSSEWYNDLLGHSETGSLGSSSSSSGVSSNSSSHLSRPGPIDNSSLLAPNPYNVPTLTGEGGHLRKDLTLSQHHDFELVPDSLWKALSQWYGGPQPLPRQVIQLPKSGVELELYPRNLRLMKHTPTNHQQAPPTSSWSGMVGGYGAAALSTVGAASYQPITSFPRRFLAYTAAFSRLATVKQVSEFICIYLKLSREDVRLWMIEDSKLNPDDDGILALLEDEMITLANLGAVDGQKLLIEIRNKDLTWPEEIGALSKSALVPGNKRNTLMNITPGSSPTPPGATGLQNLGNTCFMNAALQAVWNTGPLTRYFTKDMHLYELNTRNPLGTRGALAQRYGELCKEVWNSGARSVAPLRVRLCICQKAEQFSGGGQHDSQELLAWLLDALHEDLNRVDTRIYTELRDSDGRPDQIVAKEAWDQHTNRNQSVITELFYGQLKSKVTCTKCNHESVRFDPFNMLSLPLPMESYILVEVLVILLDGTVPIKYGLRLNSEGNYYDLREALSALCKIDAKYLLLTEVIGPRINRLPNLYTKLRAAPTIINLHAYQLPSNATNNENVLLIASREAEITGGENCVAMEVEPASYNEGLSGTNVETDVKVHKTSISAENSGERKFSHFKQIVDGDNISHKNASPSMSVKYKSNVSTKDDNFKHQVDIPMNGPLQDDNSLAPCYLVAVHRKLCRQDSYFLTQHKNKFELFGMPLLIPISEGCSSKQLYTHVWTQVARFLSITPPTPPDQSNHATDCDDSLGYTFPFTLRLVSRGGIKCAVCPWTRFCRGCTVPCCDEPFIRNLADVNSTTLTDIYNKPTASQLSTNSPKISPSSSPKLQNKLGTESVNQIFMGHDSQLQYVDFKELKKNLRFTAQHDSNVNADIQIAIDWDPTALHLRYQGTRERFWIDHSSVIESRTAHAAAVQLQHCLKAFTSEEQLEERYSCSKCQTSQRATKKLQIWRLPPILVIHLKRFQFVNNKWIKSMKVVDFPYNNFDPTAFLASIPQETILRHTEIKQHKLNKGHQKGLEPHAIEENADNEIQDITLINEINECDEDEDSTFENDDDSHESDLKLAQKVKSERRKSSVFISNRKRLISTSLAKTPIEDGDFVDYHEHKLQPNVDPLDLKYRLYAVVSHSGLMNGGHYVSYAHNPSGAWYCYNDSSCKELTPPSSDGVNSNFTPTIDPSSAYMLFYERVGLDYEPYMPNVQGKMPVLSETELADGEDSDFKKMCVIN